MAASFIPSADDLDELPSETPIAIDARMARFRPHESCNAGDQLYLRFLGNWCTILIPSNHRPGDLLQLSMPHFKKGQGPGQLPSSPSAVSMIRPDCDPKANPPLALPHKAGLSLRGEDGRTWVCAGDAASLYWFLPAAASLPKAPEAADVPTAEEVEASEQRRQQGKALAQQLRKVQQEEIAKRKQAAAAAVGERALVVGLEQQPELNGQVSPFSPLSAFRCSGRSYRARSSS